MRNVVLASLLTITALLNTGCPAAFSCGGFEGESNRVYARDNEMLILCENGGFVAMLEDRMVEGWYSTNVEGTWGTATNGEDGTLAFDAQIWPDGLRTPQLGETMWTQQDFTPTQLDHANNLCTDLELRSWWTQY